MVVKRDVISIDICWKTKICVFIVLAHIQPFLLMYLLQVGIVHEGMRFPLWLHEQISITFLVVSTLPKKPVGKMKSILVIS